MSWYDKLHIAVFGGARIFALAVSCFAFLCRFRDDPKWERFNGGLSRRGTTTAAVVIVMPIGLAQSPAAPNAFNEWIGLINECSLSRT
jgi:hypothetical protein